MTERKGCPSRERGILIQRSSHHTVIPHSTRYRGTRQLRSLGYVSHHSQVPHLDFFPFIPLTEHFPYERMFVIGYFW
jgi:hypothetical protein